MGTSTIENTLSRSLFGETRRAVLSLLFRNQDQSFYVRQIIRLVGAGQGAVQRELTTLAEAGILTRTRMGRQIYFQANRECPIFTELRNIILKTSGLTDVLRSSLEPVSDNIIAAFVYGSFAEGGASAGSDVDVMIIGNIDFKDVVKSIQQAQSELGREVNPTVYPPKEFSKMVESSNHFISDVMKGNKIFLIGDARELEKILIVKRNPALLRNPS